MSFLDILDRWSLIEVQSFSLNSESVICVETYHSFGSFAPCMLIEQCMLHMLRSSDSVDDLGSVGGLRFKGNDQRGMSKTASTAHPELTTSVRKVLEQQSAQADPYAVVRTR
jgi:hypothetical protein